MQTQYLIQSEEDDGVFITREPLFTVACTEAEAKSLCATLNSLDWTELSIRLTDLGVPEETINELAYSDFYVKYTAVSHIELNQMVKQSMELT